MNAMSIVSNLAVARAIPALALIGALAAGCSGADAAMDDQDIDGDDGASTSAAVTSGGRWTPPNSPADGTYSGGGAWNGGKACTGGMLVGTKALKARIEKEFNVSVEGYACRQNTAAANEISMHGTGRALDIMATGSSGTKIADWLVTNHKSLGLQLVIFTRTKWNATYGAKPYGGPNPHTDHVHAELSQSAAGNSSTGSGATNDSPSNNNNNNNDDLPVNPGGGDPPPPSSSSGGSSGGGSMLGQRCGSSGACNPGNNGSGLMCSGGVCIVGCTGSQYCPGNQICSAGRCE